jgi:acyl-CoA thioesterase
MLRAYHFTSAWRRPRHEPVDDLLLATSPVPSGESGRFTLDVDPGWLQGRGAYGGLVLGALTRAMEACEPEKERVLRSLTGEIAGPVLPGRADIRVTVVRRGNGVTVLRSELAREGETLAVATAVFGKKRNVAHAWSPTPPALTPWRDVAVAPIGPPFAPDFAQFLEFRLTGPMPFSGTKEARAEGWVRTRRPLPSLGAPEIVALADAFYPAAFSIETAPRPMSTIAFTLQYFPPAEPLDPTEPLYHRANALAAHEGFLSETRELWTADGRLVSLNPQTFVCIR